MTPLSESTVSPAGESLDESRPWRAIPVYVVAPIKRRYWLHLGLFLATVLTTLMVGARMQDHFAHGEMFLDLDTGRFSDFLLPISWIWADPKRLILGIPFSFTLMLILFAHEMGHFVYCVRHRIEATLPFFIPSPTFIGTFGAVIRVRSHFPSRRALFDVGIAGPIGGMLVVIPAMIFGIFLSKPTVLTPGLTFSTPAIFNLGGRLLLPEVSRPLLQFLLPHPVLVAAWFGAFITLLNLLPGGQLDGGHILYSLWPARHRPITIVLAVTLIVAGLFAWTGWILWGVILLVLRRHPEVNSTASLGFGRLILAGVALLFLAGTFMLNPFPGDSLIHQLLASPPGPSLRTSP